MPGKGNVLLLGCYEMQGFHLRVASSAYKFQEAVEKEEPNQSRGHRMLSVQQRRLRPDICKYQ